MGIRLALGFGLLVFIGCHNTTEIVVEPTPQLIYTNSFESPNDTVGWSGQGEWSIYPEGSPDGGTHSLSVRGIDVGPQAEKVLQAPMENGQFIFRFWARCLVQTGGLVRLISLAPVAPYPSAGFGIVDSVWKSYSDTASFPAGYNLRIWIDGNGAFGTPILVDRIEILKIVK